MTASKVTSASYGNLGTKGTRSQNEMTAVTGIILCTSSFNPTISEVAIEKTWTDGIRAQSVFPLVGLDNYEDQSSEDTIYDSPLQKRKLLKRGNTRYMFQFDCPLSTHRTLQTYFNNADLRVYVIRDGKICFYNNNGIAQGFSTSMLNIGRMTEVPADGSTPAFTPVYIDLANYREWDMSGDFIEPTWIVDTLESLVDVSMEEVSATATSIVVKVYAEDGYDGDGTAKEVPIQGIDCLVSGDNDFVYTASGAGSLDTITDNADGTYTFAGTGFANGDTIAVKAPSSMTTDGLLLRVTDTVTVAAIA